MTVTIPQASHYDLAMTWTESDGDPVNLTGCSAQLEIRERPAREGSPPLVSLTSAAGRVILTPLSGKVTAKFQPADTSGQTWTTAWAQVEITFPDSRRVHWPAFQVRLEPNYVD